ITHDSDDAAIAQAIIGLAHNLGLKVVAEGVETEAQALFLAAHRCDFLQGFHFSQPLDAEAYGNLELTWDSTGLEQVLREAGVGGRGAGAGGGGAGAAVSSGSARGRRVVSGVADCFTGVMVR